MSKQNEEVVEKVNQDNLLDDFKWDSEVSFFGIEPIDEIAKQTKVVEEVKKPAKEVETEVTTEKPKEGTEEEEEVDEFASFTDKDKSTKEPENKENEEGNDEDTEFYSTLSKDLKERKIFQHAEVPEEGGVTEDKFFELLDEEVEKRADDVIQDFVEEMKSDEGADLVKFLKSGGTVAGFIAYHINSPSIPELDMEKESDQDVVLRYYFKTVEQAEDDDIGDKLDWLKESGKKKKYAEKYYEKFKADDKANKEKLLKDQAEAQSKKEADRKLFSDKLKTTLDTAESVKGFAVKKADKSSLLEYITKPAVKLKGSQYLTQFQADLAETVKSDHEGLLAIAKLIKSKFDTSDLVVAKETEATKKIKSTLSTGTPRLSSTSNSKKKSLWEVF